MSFFSTIFAVVKDFIRYFNPKHTKGRYRLAVLVLAVLALTYFLGKGSNEEETAPEVETAHVSVKSVNDLAPGGSFSAVGTVEAVSEARLQTESSGRVTSVNVEIGNTVRAGTVIASLESQSEQAALLQAQGAYEAALAGAEQSNVSVSSATTALEEAQNAARTTYANAYNTTNAILRGNVSSIYTSPETSFPGVRIDGGIDTAYLNNTRIALQSSLPSWQTAASSINTNTNLNTALNDGVARVDEAITLVDTIISILNRDPKQYENTEFASLSATLSGDRATLNGVRAALTNQIGSLKQAENALNQAKLGGTTGTVSLANAQVKIALGSLRAAQANYEKTLVRTPISGVVNALYFKTGDYAAPSSPAAIVANNNGLEISTAISEEERDQIAIGDEVSIDGMQKGVISAIAGAIDPTTGKVAVKISLNEGSSLKNGSTAAVTFMKETVATNTEVTIPLSAIKMTGSGPIVFGVSEQNTLQARPVTLGAVSGDSVIVAEGLTLSDKIVVDARGLKDGQIVIVN